MNYPRFYTDENGESHLDEVEVELASLEYAPPAPSIEVSDPVDATSYVWVRFPAGWDSGLHPTPRRQLFIVLSGKIEGAASDGSIITMTAGDVLLMEDTTGKGHTARVRGENDVLALMVYLE